ncbi:unnamed protein product [Rotaria socialis]|uniref:Uncharacterized protein n=1 Tax=Rotaria socialis TaxID=392032 RepID=A0A820DSC6_9BILA|nr:unnamed protein product [Rotaria socialis]CAF3461703.1 unnamed protein product [Rotaria socialis]CAF3466076.1 unnamed protein product [Rotaria socialis]CAF3518764.1 unnamed protein product [Rotaria socialis]CAF3592515.1 unnamed protein product [Rotaria socialis]
MVPISLLILGMFVISSMAAPSMNDRQELYLDTCQTSCGSVSSNDEAEACRENFCPNYVTYLLTGLVDEHAKPALASKDRKEVGEFCATWILHLIRQLGWQNRIHLDLNNCICAAGKDCFVK